MTKDKPGKSGWRLADEVTKARIQKLVRQGKVETAPQEGVEGLDQEVLKKFMQDVFGYEMKDILLTDWSSVSDFGQDGAVGTIKRLYRISVQKRERIVDVVRTIMKMR